MNTISNTVVARLWHKRGKNEYFCARQLVEAFPDIKFEFHILLHQYNYNDNWTELFDDIPNAEFHWYSIENIKQYFSSEGFILPDNVDNFIHFYHILIGLFLYKTTSHRYMLSYEYDVLFNTKMDNSELLECIHNKIPFGVCEPYNSHCDKALFEVLCNLYQTSLVPYLKNNNPQLVGFNAGFQGINLNLFKDLATPQGFSTFLKIFDFKGIYDQDGKERMGMERTYFDTQEQSFYGLMNQIHSSNFKTLPHDKYYVMPWWLDKTEPHRSIPVMEKSFVMHFIGHKKHSYMFEFIDKKLTQWTSA